MRAPPRSVHAASKAERRGGKRDRLASPAYEEGSEFNALCPVRTTSRRSCSTAAVETAAPFEPVTKLLPTDGAACSGAGPALSSGRSSLKEVVSRLGERCIAGTLQNTVT